MKTLTKSAFVGLALAMGLFGAAAADGLARGGDAYLRGDFVSAMKFWRPDAERGDKDTQFSVGLLYFNGEGVARDYGQAAGWYRKAAAQGDGAAQNNLGLLYANGQGVPQNLVQAYKWLSLAASRSDSDPSDAARSRDQVAARMTPEQIAKAKGLVAAWKAAPVF